jgi:phenylpropionate dioxygenase-like ring-hydroxylating dioxygenase large terminal subunit
MHSTGAAQVGYTYEVVAPCAAVLTRVPDLRSLPAAVGAGNFRESSAIFVCPVSAEASCVWFRLAVADFEATDDTLRAFQDTIFMQDQIILESQTPKRLPLQLTAELHTSADKASMQYHRHLKALGCTFGVC